MAFETSARVRRAGFAALASPPLPGPATPTVTVEVDCLAAARVCTAPASDVVELLAASLDAGAVAAGPFSSPSRDGTREALRGRESWNKYMQSWGREREGK